MVAHTTMTVHRALSPTACTQRRIYNVMHAPPRSFIEAGGLAAGATPSAQNMLDDDDGTPLMQRYDKTHATTHIIWTVSVYTVMFLNVR